MSKELDDLDKVLAQSFGIVIALLLAIFVVVLLMALTLKSIDSKLPEPAKQESKP